MVTKEKAFKGGNLEGRLHAAGEDNDNWGL